MATEDKRIDQLPAVETLSADGMLVIQQNGEAMNMTAQQLVDYLSQYLGAGSAVLYISQSLTTNQKKQARTNIGAASSSDIPTSVVKYTSQTLTDAQKAQARANIGAAAPGEGGSGSAANAVLYVSQTLTDAQQIQARKNIRCGSVGEVDGEASGMYSHAEGYRTGASGAYSHAEGCYAGASGAYSHAEGNTTSAIGAYSHAEGYYTQTNGDCSHAEGYYTQANGNYSHAEGLSSFAQGENQHVQGKFNIKDYAGKYAHIVGNGASNVARSNANTLDWDGVPWFKGRAQCLGNAQDDGAQTVMLNGDTEITLTDRTTGVKYNLYIDNGKLMTEVVS